MRSKQILFLCSAIALSFIFSTLTGCERVNQRRARRLANRAVSMIKKEQYFSAQGVLKRAIKLYAHDAHTRFLLARVYQKRNMPGEAIREYKRCIYLDPDKIQAYYSLGNIYFKNKDYKKAAEQYAKLVEKKPDHPYGAYHLGMAKHKLNDYITAEKFFKAAIKIKPNFVQAYNNLTAVYYDQAKVKTDPAQAAPFNQQAITTIRTAIDKKIANERSYNLLGLVYQNQKNFEEAIKSFNKAKKRNAYSASAAYNLGATFDLWLDEFLNKAKEEKDKTKQEEIMKEAAVKRDEAIKHFKEFLQLKGGDEGLKMQIRMKIRKLNLMKEKELDKKLKKQKRRRRRRRRR